MAVDSNGATIRVGDTVAVYGYLSDEGYSTDEGLDQRERGVVQETVIQAIEGCVIQDEKGHWWHVSDTLLLKQKRCTIWDKLGICWKRQTKRGKRFLEW